MAKNPPPGWLALDSGMEVGRETYPQLWEWLQENAPLISETEWQAQAAVQSSVGYYSTGDGSTTFRLPKILDYPRGGLASEVGTWLDSQNKSHTHNYSGDTTVSNGSGYHLSGNGNIITPVIGAKNTYVTTAEGGDEARGKTIKFLFCVKAFDAVVNPGLVDTGALAAEVARKLDATETGFAIIYPNGGSAASPANVTANTRYVLDNPFPGYHVLSKVEVYYHDMWAAVGIYGGNAAAQYAGIGCEQDVTNDKIVLQVRYAGVIAVNSSYGGDVFNKGGDTPVTSAPCRVKVWKLKGMIV